MIIKCWGARGSIPVSGSRYLKYGGDTPCLEIRTKNGAILIIDAGTGIRRLGNSLIKEGITACSLIFTHSHWDHIMGFPFFMPLYSKKTRIEIYGCKTAQGSIKKLLADVMAPPHFPIAFDSIKAELSFHEKCGNTFSFDSMTVEQIALSHPNGGFGFKFTEDGKSFVFLTDNELSFRHHGGLVYQDYLEFSRGASLLIHDAEFTDEEYRETRKWGHSPYTEALKLALEARVERFGLFHHNQERGDKALDAIIEDCRTRVEQHSADMECFGVAQDMEIQL